MGVLCHRCHAPLENGSSYCANCGAPQVSFIQSEDSGVSGGVSSTGSLAAPARTQEQLRRVQWKIALGIVALIALAAGLLSAIGLGPIWVLSGAVLAVFLYRRRLPGALLDARAGARIGIVLGLFAAATSVFVQVATLVILRFVLHQGSTIDSSMTEIIGKFLALSVAMGREMAPNTPQQIPAAFWLSPEGRAGLQIYLNTVTAVLVILFSAAGGALGARWFNRSRPR